MSRDHRSLHSATALLAKHDRALVPGNGGRHRMVKPSAADTPVMPRVVEDVPPVVDAETQELIVQLHALGAEMRFVDDEPDLCPCTETGGFRVYDGRRDDGLRYEELCRGCVVDHVKHCRTDAVVVEVCIR